MAQSGGLVRDGGIAGLVILSGFRLLPDEQNIVHRLDISKSV